MEPPLEGQAFYKHSDFKTTLNVACVAGGMRERASGGGAALFHRGPSPLGIRERRSRE